MTHEEHPSDCHAPIPVSARVVVALLSAIGLAMVTGCSSVAPYQRGKLAHPTMAVGDMSGFIEGHTRAVQEGAVGGGAGAGSGCGCN